MIHINGRETRIDTAKKNAGALFGQNSCFGWDAHFKENLNVDIAASGFGNEFIPNITYNSFNLINDNDGVDFPTTSFNSGTFEFVSNDDMNRLE